MKIVWAVVAFLLMPAIIAEERTSTAANNVQVLSDILTIPKLQRKRTIRLYLPPDYATGTKKYPVLYMHDGQNLFDAKTSFVGEWGVDEALNTLHASHGIGVIVVGIDNGQSKRVNEYSPWENPKYSPAEGREYVDFIIQKVKPYIDTNYRTLPEAANTGIMGSSLGGLISHYAIVAHPEVFTKAGIYSPSFWFSDEVYDYTDEMANNLTTEHRIHMLGGSEEGDREMGARMLRVNALMTKNKASGPRIKVDIIPGGEHNERFWAEHFPATIKYLYQPVTDNNNNMQEANHDS